MFHMTLTICDENFNVYNCFKLIHYCELNIIYQIDNSIVLRTILKTELNCVSLRNTSHRSIMSAYFMALLQPTSKCGGCAVLSINKNIKLNRTR